MQVILVAAAAALLYAPVAAGMFQQWWAEPDNSHGLLLAAVAAFLVVRRRDLLRTTPLAPRDIGFAVVGASVLLFTLGSIAGELFLLRLSLPVLIAGVVLALGGAGHLRLLAAPLVLLLLAIPLPAVVVTHATMPLQLIASQVAAGVLQLCQVDVVREGNLLMLQPVTLEVADACSGLRSLVSLVSLAAVGIALFPMSGWRAAALLSAAVPVAIVGNGLRVAATGLLASWFGPVAARGIIHDATGYAAFIVMCAIVIGVQIATKPRMPGLAAA